MVSGILIAVLTTGLIFGGWFVLKKATVSSSSSEMDSLLGQIAEFTKEIQSQIDLSKDLASKGQLESLSSLLTALKKDIETEANLLKEIEAKLENAQVTVEERESGQQNLKTAKQEDEARLQELLATYSDIYSESVTLEQKLAASMKNLDTITKEVELTQVQRDAFQELNDILTNASSRLRDLIMEYETTKQRLEMLRQQHDDLEEEYTKLVEQQLGG